MLNKFCFHLFAIHYCLCDLLLSYSAYRLRVRWDADVERWPNIVITSIFVGIRPFRRRKVSITLNLSNWTAVNFLYFITSKYVLSSF